MPNPDDRVTVRRSDDVARCIDAVGLRVGKTWRQEHVQIHGAIGGSAPKKRMSHVRDFAPTDLPAGCHSHGNAFIEVVGVKVNDTVGGACPK